MKTKTHVLFAVFIAVAIALYLKFERIYLFGLIIGVLLPDILEPPVSMFHRKFFHSKRLLRFMIFFSIIMLIVALVKENFFWLFFITLGYIIHLIGDWLFHRLPR